MATKMLQNIVEKWTIWALLVAVAGLAACSGADRLGQPRTIAGTTDRSGRTIGVLPPGVGIAAGQPAPRSHAHDAADQQVELGPIFDAGPTLLVFYRGGWCPFCQVQIRSLLAAQDELKHRGVRVVVVSVDPPADGEKKTLAMADSMLVLHDADLAAHTAFGVVHVADEAEVKSLRDRGVAVDGTLPGDRRFAVPAVFLVQKGQITWAHAEPEYRNPPVFDDLRPVLEAAGLRIR